LSFHDLRANHESDDGALIVAGPKPFISDRLVVARDIGVVLVPTMPFGDLVQAPHHPFGRQQASSSMTRPPRLKPFFTQRGFDTHAHPSVTVATTQRHFLCHMIGQTQFDMPESRRQN
jgi:hypothetical protein